MIRFNGTPETVHYTNWVLHSGCVDPWNVVIEGMRRATQAGEYEDEAEQGWVSQILAEILDGVSSFDVEIPSEIVANVNMIDIDEAAKQIWRHVKDEVDRAAAAGAALQN
jgi:hypothetical protein